MEIALSPEMENLVKEKIASGYYRSPEDVVNAGLRLLRQIDEAKVQALREDLSRAVEQLKNGEGRPFDAEKIKKLGRERAGNRKETE